jgi:hypothetical protein
MEAGLNYVLIRPDADWQEMAGLRLGGEWEQERQWSVWGTVVAVPPGLSFIPHIPGWLEFNQWATDKSLEWDTDMELSVGDRVLYRYNVRMDEDGVFEDADGLLLMVRYDSIYAKQVDGELYPLNGYIFVAPDGRVVAKGRPLRRYLHYPEREDGEIGDRVLWSAGRGVRVEVPEFETLGGLMRMQRKEVLLWFLG